MMILNEPGRMVEKWWNELENKFSSIDQDAFIIMPNHIHGILAFVGAALRGRPEERRPLRGAPTLGDVMDWFKTMTTNDYIHGVKQHQWRPFPGKLWQRNYYEHIVRNEDGLMKIREYITNNPARWAEDKENPDVE